jgi:hypothetical protein
MSPQQARPLCMLQFAFHNDNFSEQLLKRYQSNCHDGVQIFSNSDFVNIKSMIEAVSELS